jgi:hypothetical protein
MSVIPIAVIVLATHAAPLKPPPPIIEYQEAELSHGTLGFRCHDGGAEMTISLRPHHELSSWRIGSRDLASPKDLRQISQKLSELKLIGSIRAACERGSAQIRFIGTDSVGNESAVTVVSSQGDVWVTKQ